MPDKLWFRWRSCLNQQGEKSGFKEEVFFGGGQKRLTNWGHEDGPDD